MNSLANNGQNIPAAPNAGIASRLAIGYHCPGVGEPGRSAIRHTQSTLEGQTMKTTRCHLALLVSIVMLMTLTIGCSKSASQPLRKDLGVVEFSDATPSRFDLGAGKECVITPRFVSNNAVELQMSVEAKNRAGASTRVGFSLLTVQSGQQFAVSVGGTIISMTPKIKAK